MDMEAADVALLLSEFPEDRLPILFRLLPKELAAETFVEMDNDQQELLIQSFSTRSCGKCWMKCIWIAIR